MTVQEVRKDLRAIRYYYSKQKDFEKAAETVGANRVAGIAQRYHRIVTNASPRLYEVYVQLYLRNNTQETLAFDWDCSTEYIKRLNKQLYEFIIDQFKEEN
ncbi:MAG: hypothetical protein K2L12_03270 [Clostridia bacterium]|nr:hypothetical protein [Clostridia bacterium]